VAFQQLKLPTRDGFSFSLSFDPTLRFTADKRWVWGAAAGALRFEDERPACAPGAAATRLGTFLRDFFTGPRSSCKHSRHAQEQLEASVSTACARPIGHSLAQTPGTACVIGADDAAAGVGTPADTQASAAAAIAAVEISGSSADLQVLCCSLHAVSEIPSHAGPPHVTQRNQQHPVSLACRCWRGRCCMC